MFIEVFNNNGYQYVRIVRSIYRPGGKGAGRETVKNLGALSKYDDGQPNYAERLKESFRQGHPIIPGIEQYCNQNYKKPEDDGLCSIEVSPDNPGQMDERLFSQCLIESYLRELGLIKFLSMYKSTEKIPYDVVGFFRLLVYGRILDPASKFATAQQNECYYNPIVSEDANEYDVYRTLDFIEKYGKGIVRQINNNLIKKFKRTTDCVFYDCTNFFFETLRPDADVETEDGETIHGIRKKGFSKEHRTSPIVQMGLFTDEQGVPISIEMFPGNTLDCKTVRKSLSGIEGLTTKRFIFVGDRGMYSDENRLQLLEDGNGYIISKSIAKTAKSEKDWILSEDDYIRESEDFKHKSRIVTRKVTGKDGTEHEMQEKIVVYWSSKYERQQYAENQKALDAVEMAESCPQSSPFVPEKKKGTGKFLKNEYVNTETGEVIKRQKLRASVDQEAVAAFKKSAGYYQIVTSETDMTDLEIIDKYHGLARIEEQFRIMKSTLDTRPIYVRKPEHIYAHLLICMIALVIIRLIQNKIVQHQGKPPAKNWSSGLSSDRIRKALNMWHVILLKDGRYMMLGSSKPDLQTIFEAYGIKQTRDVYTKKQLLELKTSIKVI